MSIASARCVYAFLTYILKGHGDGNPAPSPVFAGRVGSLRTRVSDRASAHERQAHRSRAQHGKTPVLKGKNPGRKLQAEPEIKISLTRIAETLRRYNPIVKQYVAENHTITLMGDENHICNHTLTICHLKYVIWRAYPGSLRCAGA